MVTHHRTAVVTGASSGIGFYITKGLMELGFRVFMICRNADKAREAIFRLNAHDTSQMILVLADLSSQAEVRIAAQEINEKATQIDVLVNNAGGVRSLRTLTEDGIEWQFAVNYLAPFLMTALLLDKLKAADDGRIINISSRAHARGKVYFEDIMLEKGYTISKAYNQSKLAIVLFTYALANKLKDTKVTVNVMHPGLVNTYFGNKQVSLFHDVVWQLLKRFGSTPEKAAETAIYLATSEELQDITGKYFAFKEEANSSSSSKDSSISQKLWNLSQAYTKTPFKL